MTVKLKNARLPGIPSHNMKDGEIAIITEWSVHKKYVGSIVTRFGKSLVRIGHPECEAWPLWFDINTTGLRADCRVELLPSGTELVIE